MKNSKGRDRDFGGRSQMHNAICADCGKECQVPFMPTGDKPVYCSDCFSKRKGDMPRRSEGRDFGRPKFRERDRNRQMYSAVCDKCGKPCQVPFQPTPGKPIYCEQCFGKDRGGDRGGAPKGDQLSSINAKLDKIINALIVAKIIKPFKEANPEIKKAEVKKPEAKKVKPVAKKAVTKKPAKKVAKKKK